MKTRGVQDVFVGEETKSFGPRELEAEKLWEDWEDWVGQIKRY